MLGHCSFEVWYICLVLRLVAVGGDLATAKGSILFTPDLPMHCLIPCPKLCFVLLVNQAITKPHPVPSNPHINRLIRISIPHFRRLANWLYHLLLIPSTRIQYIFVHARRTYLNHLRPNLLSAFSHSNSHIAQQRRMPNVTGIAVSLDIARPLESCRVCVPRSDISRLEGFELLLCA
jgi:hypothetical protein